jgi:hypothetical protein
VVGGVVVVAEEFGEDRGGDGDCEREERAGAGGARGDPELAKSAADAFGSDVRAGFGAGEQPRVGGVLVLVSQQCGEWFGDGDGVLTEAEWRVVVLVDLEVGGAESDDAGDELAVEQQQRSGDPDRRLDVVIVKKRAGLSEACGVIDRRVARPRWRPRDVQRREDPGGVRPVQERAGRDRSAWRTGQPVVELSLSGPLERQVVLVQPEGEADRDAEFLVVGPVGALARLAGSELAGVVGSELPSRVGGDVGSVGVIAERLQRVLRPVFVAREPFFPGREDVVSDEPGAEVGRRLANVVIVERVVGNRELTTQHRVKHWGGRAALEPGDR